MLTIILCGCGCSIEPEDFRVQSVENIVHNSDNELTVELKVANNSAREVMVSGGRLRVNISGEKILTLTLKEGFTLHPSEGQHITTRWRVHYDDPSTLNAIARRGDVKRYLERITLDTKLNVRGVGLLRHINIKGLKPSDLEIDNIELEKILRQ